MTMVRREFDALYRSCVRRFRKKRKAKFSSLFAPEKFRTLIDVGGLAEHWNGEREVTVLNLMPQRSEHCKVIIGDGRNTGLPTDAFDIAYSNSAIEHVGDWSDQRAFANEIHRIGRAVWCQTPNRWFPIEVHYLTILIHWYPKLLKNYYVARYLTGWGWLVKPDRAEVERYARSVNLLSATQLKALFPNCQIARERFLGFTKSLIAVRK